MINEMELRVKNTIINTMELEYKAEDISEETTLESLGFNSISFIKMIVALELEFDLEFEDSDLNISDFNTFKDIVTCINNKLK